MTEQTIFKYDSELIYIFIFKSSVFYDPSFLDPRDSLFFVCSTQDFDGVGWRKVRYHVPLPRVLLGHLAISTFLFPLSSPFYSTDVKYLDSWPFWSFFFSWDLYTELQRESQVNSWLVTYVSSFSVSINFLLLFSNLQWHGLWECPLRYDGYSPMTDVKLVEY